MNSLSYKDNRNYLVNLLAAALSNTTTTSAWFCNALAAHAVSIGPSIIALTASALFSPLATNNTFLDFIIVPIPGSLTLAHSQYSQMSFMYGFFFVKFLFFTVVCVVIVI